MGKGCVWIWDRSVQKSGFHGNFYLMVIMGETELGLFLVVFHRICFILAGSGDMHESPGEVPSSARSNHQLQFAAL